MFPNQSPKPRFRDLFVTDIRRNLLRVSNGGETQLYRHHLLTECVWYSCDMCLEFQRKSDGLLTSDWIEHIVTEVGAAITMLCPRDFGEAETLCVIQKTKELLQFPSDALQKEIDNYYRSL